MNSPSTKRLLKNQRNQLHFEALEPRVLFDASAGGAPTAEVTVTNTDAVEPNELTTDMDQMVNDDVNFTLTFDNNGGQEGYQPYVDFVADPALDISSVTAYGTELENPGGSGFEPIGMVAADGQLVDISSGLPIDHPIYAGTTSTSFGLAGSGTPPVLYDTALQGQYVYSVNLPFGSFTPGSPPVDVNVVASLNVADGILPNQDYTLSAQGGFALGCDASDNVDTDAPITGAMDEALVHPMIFDLVKTAQVRELEDPFTGEMPTGPNHPITYFLEIDIADGETLTNFSVTDLLPSDLAYAGNLLITGATASSSTEPTVNTDGITGVAPGDDTLTINFASVTGTAGTPDIIISYEAFGAYVEGGSGAIVVNETSGQESDIKFNDASATGTWNGQSLTDDAAPGADPDGFQADGVTTFETDYAIEEHSLAIQKGVDFAPGGGDRASSGWAEGDVAEYTLNFQISDYFAFNNVTIQDDMADGIEFLPALDPGSTWANAADFDNDALEMRPELVFTMHNAVPSTITVLFDEANFDATENPNGTTTVNYDVYQQLVDSGFIADGDPLIGGLIPETGIDPADMGTATFNSGVATVGTIRYRALVRDEYQSLFTSDPSINQGDSIVNDVVITGQNLDVETFGAIQNVTDDSGAIIEITTGTVQKELFSATRNGNQILAADLDSGAEVMPGDVITWRITYDLPSTEFENLILRDYLPLPVFDEAAIDTTQIYAYGDPGYLTAGRISFGENDTFFGQNGPGATGDGGIDDAAGYVAPAVPSISLIPADNAFEINFGDYEIPEASDPVNTTIELFVSTVIQDGIYADGLLFTNQVGVSENDSNLVVVASNEIAMIELTVPDLQITKGVVSTETPNGGSFTAPVGPGTVSFGQPGSDPAWTGTVTSESLVTNPLFPDRNPIDANNVGMDAADVVTFGVTVENHGASDEGAFDVTISDTVPEGFIFPASAADAAFNLQVRDGNGTALAYTVTNFDSVNREFEIQLTDSVNQGALTEYDPTSGTNLVIVTYDLVIEDDVDPAQVLTNTATVENYSYQEGGLDYAGPEDTDIATVTVARPVVNKTIIDTSHDDTDNLDMFQDDLSGSDPEDLENPDGDNEVTIGEIVTYSVTISIPEGHMENSRILDTLPPGMAFIGLDSISFDPALSTTVGVGDFSDVEAVYNSNLNVLELGVGGSAGLGTITNADRDNTIAEEITFTYRAVVLNDAANQAGLLRTNDAEMRWVVNSVDQVAEDSADALVVEPDVTVDKSVVGGTTDVQGAEEIIYEIVVTNNNSDVNVSEAYDVELLDVLPDDVEYVAASLTFVSGVAPNVGTLQFDAGQGTEGAIVAQWDRLGVGEEAVIRVTVRIDDGLATDTVITNTAGVEFSSLPGDPGDAGYNGYDGSTVTGPNVNSANTVLDDAIERTGDPTDQGGAVNDYNDDDPAVVTVINPVGIDKAIIDTAEAHTDSDNSGAGAVQGAIGEVIRYEVRVRIPQAENSQLQLIDTMSENLIWIDSAENNLQIELEGFDTPGSLIAEAGIGAANGTAIALDPARAVYSAATNSVTFSFGDITNLETDGGPEFLVLSYNAIVGNDTDALDGDGTTSRGDVLVNSVQLYEGGGALGTPFSVPVEIVEPELNIQKSDNGVDTADAGDVITYTLDVTAVSSSTHTTAFDIVVGDVLPDELDLVSGTLNIIGLPGTSSIVLQSEDLAADSISVTIDQLAPGESFQIEFDARVRDTGADIIHSDETVTNTATLAYSSLPGDGTDDGTGDNATGNESGTPNDEDGERTYTDSDTDSFTTPTPTFQKELADPAITTFTIGEPVEYVLTLEVPEGRVGDPNAFILDTIDPGFRFVPGTLLVTPGAGITVGTAGLLDEANATFFTHTDPGDTAVAETIRFDFGFVDFNNAAAGDGVDTTGTIEIRYQLQVENILANQEGDALNNIADFFYTDDDGTTQNTIDDSTGDVDTIITLVEPQVNTVKSITNITAPEAGGIVTYRIAMTHPGGVGNPLFNATAFDVTIQDVMPPGVDIQNGTFTAFRNGVEDVSSFFTLDANGRGFTDDGLGSIDMDPGDLIVITYNALITPAVQDGVSLINEVDVEWTSLDGGDPNDGIDPGDTGERTGDGDPDAVVDPSNPNDYENEDTAEFDVEFTNTFAFTKTITGTSADHTDIAAGTDVDITDLTIGETVTYALTATVGRGTVDGVRITDQLDLTAGFLDITDVSFTTGAQLSSPNFASATPTITDTNLDGYNDSVEYDFGTVVNDPSLFTFAADDEQIIVYITATVVNDIENQGGDIITNTGTFYYFDDPTDSGTQTEQDIDGRVDVEIVEPDLNVAKSITNVPANPDAADVVSYRILVTNTSDTDAFDVTFQDILPVEMDLNLASFSATLTSTGGDVSNFFNLTANDIRHAGTGFNLGAGDIITIDYDTTILSTVTDGALLTNEVDIEWTTLDDDVPTSGDPAEERGGDGDPDNPAAPGNPNDYESEDEETVESNLLGYSFDKSISSTSMTHTDETGGTSGVIEDLVVGETVTYVLTATFAEGTTTGVFIEDDIQIANGILDVRNVSFTLGSNITGTATPVIRDIDGDLFSENVLLDFGTVVNSGADGVDPAADQILVYIEAVVENVIENQEGDIIQNDAEFRFLEDSNDDNIIDGSDTPTVLEDDELVEILEPNLSITKAVSNETPKLNEVITYTLTITNNASASTTDAFDVAISDFMDPAMTLDPSSILLSIVGTPTTPSSIISNNSTSSSFDLVIDVLEEGESIQVIYDVTVSSDPADFMTVFPNVADLEYTSTPGDNPDERGGDPDPSDPDDPNDYNDSDNESIEVHQPDLRIQKVDDGQRIFPGQLFDYTMTVTNQGRATALGVTITDDISNYLAEGFQFVSGTNATISGGVVTFALPDMPVDDVQVVTLTLRAPRIVPAGLEEIVNVAQANHIDIEPTPGDNEDDEPTPIIALPDLTVVKDDGLTYATVGDEVTYAITFDNVGNQVASGVVIKDTLPPGVQFISATDGGRVVGGAVVWNIDELRPGDGDTFYVTVELLTDGLKINNVTIEDDGTGGPDPTPENNKDQDRTISEPGFQFDLNQNFLSGPGNTSSIIDDFRQGDFRPTPLFEHSPHQPVMYATYMNSGLAQPGSTITLEVYDQMGRLIGDTSVVADTGGNWLATFPMADVESLPSRVVIKQTWASADPESQRGYNFRTYFGPAFTTGTYYTEELSIWNVTEKRAATEVIDLYESSKMVLALDWNGTTYEFAARGALQSSSGN